MAFKALDRYTIAAVLPYLALALLVLSAILLIQQTTKFAEVLGSSSAPLRLATEVTLNLLPNILIFTLPMSVLVGVATGFGQLGHDSELTAIQAAGVGTYRIILPPLLLGLLFSLLTFYVGFWVAPAAAKNLRDIGLQIAFYKLESPVDPRSFYTGMQGKVIYVREGDKETGQWGRIFMHWQEPDGQVRLVTARTGRLDFSGERTELVLEDARMTTLPAGGAEAIARGEHVTVERSESMRVRDERLDTGRGALARRMQEREPEFDEMGLRQLSKKVRTSDNIADHREATIALHKRLALSFSPIVFAFFGAALGLRTGRGGRSQGILLSLASMLLYYLLSLAGEQLGRAGTLPPILGSWLAFITAIPCGFLLLAAKRRHFGFRLKRVQPENDVRAVVKLRASGAEKRRRFVPGLLDRDVLKSVVRNFLLIVSTLVLIFFVFTLFELLRFVARNHVSAIVVARYFMYLLPFALVAITPVGTLLSVLVTFALMVRRSESVAWWASGQSVFRLIQPCVFFAVFVGVGVWFVQEKVMPNANRRQNALRGMIRTGAVQADVQSGKVWVSSADTRRIYSYDPVSVGGQLNNLSIFDFDAEALHLERVLVTPDMNLAPGAFLEGRGESIELGGGGATYKRGAPIRLSAGDFYMLNGELNKPAELDAKSLSAYIRELKARGVNVAPLSVVLERKRAEPFSPLIMILVGAPLAFVFGRRGTMVALCMAIGSGLAFLGLTSGFQQAGANGILNASVAAWAPSLLFLAIGGYLLTRTRT
jgi:LPS export ABC transporter permease LptF/LPS export ABC transporter permease LptG